MERTKLPAFGRRIEVGLNPYTPLIAAGFRILPPISVPTPMALPPMPNKAPSPPLLPPEVKCRPYELTVGPRKLSHSRCMMACGLVVLT